MSFVRSTYEARQDTVGRAITDMYKGALSMIISILPNNQQKDKHQYADSLHQQAALSALQPEDRLLAQPVERKDNTDDVSSSTSSSFVFPLPTVDSNPSEKSITPRTVEHLRLNTLTITVTDKNFLAGYDIGYRQFQELYQGKTLADLDLLSILLDNLGGMTHTCTYKIGLVTGWYAALFGYSHQTGEQP